MPQTVARADRESSSNEVHLREGHPRRLALAYIPYTMVCASCPVRFWMGEEHASHVRKSRKYEAGCALQRSTRALGYHSETYLFDVHVPPIYQRSTTQVHVLHHELRPVPHPLVAL